MHMRFHQLWRKVFATSYSRRITVRIVILFKKILASQGAVCQKIAASCCEDTIRIESNPIESIESINQSNQGSTSTSTVQVSTSIVQYLGKSFSNDGRAGDKPMPSPPSASFDVIVASFSLLPGNQKIKTQTANNSFHLS
jgi:hypothetical protein